MPRREKGVGKRNRTGAGLAIPAGLFIGMGIGAMTQNFVPWLFLGLGIGFIVFLILRLLGK